MAKRKRKHGEFASDFLDPSKTVNGSKEPMKGSDSNLSTKTPATDVSEATSPETSTNIEMDGEPYWEVTLSKKDRKRKKKQEKAANEDVLGPSLYFHNKIVNPLRIKDLQNLVLYVLSDAVAPVWLALKNGKQVEHVVVVMVPGMDKPTLLSLASVIKDNDDGERQTSSQCVNSRMEKPKTSEDSGEDQVTDQPPNSRALPNSPLEDCIIPIKAPGDVKTGKIHSSLQSMLISPEVKSNGYKGADNVFAPVPTPVTQFIHTADELVEAQYPVHPAIFTNSKDAQLELSRRESAGQSSTSGWVDTDVDAAKPVPPDDNQYGSDLSVGLQVYALDCEMVVTTDDAFSLARISVINWFGKVVLDRFVRPDLPIKDYCTAFSGITEKKLDGVKTTLRDIQQELRLLLTPSTIVIGHSLESDFNAMKLTHPFVADTSILYPHPRGLPLRSSLKFLANKYLKREIQKGGEHGHDSVEDARAVLDLVRLKCEKGPRWGTMDANGDSIFGRLNRSGCRTAIVEYGTPEKGFGRLASVHIGCQSDDQITDGVIEVAKKQEPREKVNFVFGRLRDMENAQDWEDAGDVNPSQIAQGDDTTFGDTLDGSKAISPDQELIIGNSDTTNLTFNGRHSKLEKARAATVARLSRIYNAFAPSTLFIAFSGPSDMREVKRLLDMQKQYRKEFRVKKWDELSVKWTDDEMQALRKATEQARKGWAMVCLK